MTVGAAGDTPAPGGTRRQALVALCATEIVCYGVARIGARGRTVAVIAAGAVLAAAPGPGGNLGVATGPLVPNAGLRSQGEMGTSDLRCRAVWPVHRLPGAAFNQWVMTSAETDGMLRALADPLRARIVELLAGEQLCTCHLVELSGARQTNVSNHLRVLREAGLVEPRPAGRYTFYRLRPEALTALAGHYAALADRARSAAQLRRPCT